MLPYRISVTFLLILVCFVLVMLASNDAKAQQQAQGGGLLKLENELLLDVRLDGISLGFAILGYQDDDRIWLALSELMDVLQFPVNVDATSGRAGGWFLEEERTFSLDLNSEQVTSGEQSFLLSGQALAFGSEIFVQSRALERWFPVILDTQVRELALDVQTLETIPLQARLSRRRSHVLSGSGAINREPELPFQYTPYRFVGAHATDIRLSMNSSLEDEDDTSTSFGGNYSLLSRGDLAWMTSTIAVSGRKDDEISNGRLKLERSDINGPLRMDYVEVGDVDAGSRGLLIRGGGAQQGLTGLFSDERVDLRGDIPPDWEVELYRNGVLIDVQVVDGDAQYEFLDVPLEFGENRFEFVLYGPFGEERREQQVYYAGRSNLSLGEVSYELAAIQDGRSVFDIREGTAKGDEGSGRFLGDFNVGLASNAVASFGFDSFLVNSQREQDYSAGVTVNFARLQVNAGYEDRALAQDEATGLLRTRMGKVTTATLGYTHYIKGSLPDARLPSDRPEWNGRLALSTRVARLPVNFNATHQQRASSDSSAASIGTTASFRTGARVSKTFYYDRENSFGNTQERTGGVLNVSADMRPWRLRAGVGYNISPETEVNSVNASASLRVDSNMTMNFDVNHSAQIDYTSYRTGFNWLLDYLQISPQIIYDSNQRWVGLVSLSTSFNPRPDRTWPAFNRLSQANSGAVYAQTFMDENGNGIRDEYEPGLEDVRVDAVQGWRSTNTGADGRGYITRLRRDRVTDIAVDASSLPGLDTWPVSEGVSVKPRPGSWSRVDIPVIRTMELEGHVQVKPVDSAASMVPVERARVALTNKAGEVVASQRTAFDGFFLFSEVPPGVYQLALSERLQPRVSEHPTKVGVNAQGGIIRDLDFVLTPPKGRQLVGVGQPEAKDEPAPGPAFAPESGTSRAVPVLEPAAEARLQPQPASRQPEQSDKTPDGNWYVQLGAFSEQENARTYWRKLQADDVIPQTYSLKLQTTGQLFRLLAGPGQPEAGARKLCRQVKAAGADCLVRELANP